MVKVSDITDKQDAAILVVDDNIDNIRAMELVLDEFGYGMRSALDGEAALRSARAQPPDLILLDIYMPRLNGYDTCKALKADERTRDVPVIFLAALTEEFDRVKGFRAGAVDFVSKPLQLDELRARIKVHIQLLRQQRELVAQTEELRCMRDLAVREKQRAEEHLSLLEDSEARLRTTLDNLAAAKAAAEQSSRAKSDFLAAMSHEIRTPMNGVVGTVDLLNRTSLDDDQRKLVRLARDSAVSLMQIINDILDFSKIEAGQMTVEDVDVNWFELVEGVAELLAVQAFNKHLQIYCFVGPEVPTALRGDPVRLRQIMFNLLGNAIKFTETTNERRGRIEIRVAYQSDDNDPRLRVEVTDNGIGMSNEQVEQLFKPFTQADTSIHRRFGGTGLGLSICYHLTNIMGGSITCKSQPGEGACFTLLLPAVVVKQPASDGSFVDLDGLNLLLATNDRRLRSFLERDLTCRGAHVQMSGASGAAIASAAVQPPDVIITQSNVEEAGNWLLADIRAHPALSEVPIVVVDEPEHWMQDSESRGVSHVHSNPFRPMELRKRIAASCGRAAPDERISTELEGCPVDIPGIEQAEARLQLILVAEDNIINQEVIERQLNLLGYTALVANNGREALELLKIHKIGLLLTDCHMPEMDGFDLTSAVRGQELGAHTRLPIVAITANVLKGEAKRCLAVGMDDYISKPVELDKLQRVLRRWLPSRAASWPNARAASDDENRAEGHESVIDHVRMKNYLGEDRQIQRHFLKRFADQGEEIVTAILSAAAERDWIRVSAQAHKLKSSAAAVGAVSLSSLCARLEGDEGHADAATAGDLSSQLRDEFDRVSRYVETLKTSS